MTTCEVQILLKGKRLHKVENITTKIFNVPHVTGLIFPKLYPDLDRHKVMFTLNFIGHFNLHTLLRSVTLKTEHHQDISCS